MRDKVTRQYRYDNEGTLLLLHYRLIVHGVTFCGVLLGCISRYCILSSVISPYITKPMPALQNTEEYIYLDDMCMMHVFC